MFLTGDPAWSQIINREKKMSNRRFAAIAVTLTACIFIMLVGIGLSARNRTVVAKKSPVTDAGFVPMAAGTEMAPKSKWGAIPTTAKNPAGVVLDFATLTDNGTTAYKIVENDFMQASEGVLFSEPYDAKSGSLGFGIVERTQDGRFFPCVMNVSARGTGTMRWFSQSGNGNPSNICLFTPND